MTLLFELLVVLLTCCCHGFVVLTPSGRNTQAVQCRHPASFELYESTNEGKHESKTTLTLNEEKTLSSRRRVTTQSSSEAAVGTKETTTSSNRRDTLRDLATAFAVITTITSTSGGAPIALAASSKKRTTVDDGNLPDLPPEAQRSYMQYRAALQTSADYYIFELQDSIGDTDQWGEIGQLFATSGARGGQGQPNRIERDFINPMRILELSMPPEEADALRDARFQFESSMQKIQKATAGIRRDLPVEIMPAQVTMAKQGWEDGRKALNEYFVTLNQATGLEGELQTIPPAGPNQFVEYGRSQRKFFELMKKTKLCQNRGGTTLANTWGGLMVSGYMQDSCGIPDMTDYFFQ